MEPLDTKVAADNQKGVLPASLIGLLLGLAAQMLLWLDRQRDIRLQAPWISRIGPWLALGMYLLAGGLFVWVALRTRRPADGVGHGAHCEPVQLTAEWRLLDWLPAILTCVASLVAILHKRGHASHPLVWVFGVAAVLGAVLSICRLAWRQSSSASGSCQSRQANARATGWAELAFIALLLLVALFVRMAQWDQVPSGVFFDEARNGLDAVDILEQGTYPLWSDSLSGRPTLHLHLLAVLFRLIGVRVFSMKVLSAIWGTWAVAAVYALGRRIYGPVVGMVAALLLAFSHYHVHYSRLIFEAVMTPATITLAIAFFWRALRQDRWSDYVLCAVTVAGGLYTYVSFRILPLIFLLIAIHGVLKEPGFIKRHGRGLLCCGALLAVLSIPLARFAVNNPERFFNRLSEVALTSEIEQEGSWNPALTNAIGYLTMYNWRGDRNRIMNVPGEPGLSIVPSVFFALGLAITIWRVRERCYSLLLIWLLVALLPGALTHSIETPHSTRVIGALPAVVLIAGLAARTLWRALGQVSASGAVAWQAVRYGLVAVLLGAGAVQDLMRYFDGFATNPNCYYGFEPAANRVGQLLEAWQSDYHLVLSPSYDYVFPEDAVVRFVSHNLEQPYLPLDYVRDIPYRGEINRDVAYILEPRYEPVVTWLRFWYPEGELNTVRDPYGAKLFLTYVVTEVEARSVRGLTATHVQVAPPQIDFADGLSGRSTMCSGSVPCEASWQGGLYAPLYGSYAFRLRGDFESANGVTALHIDDQSIAWNQPVMLAKGMHAIELSGQFEPGDRFEVRWRLPSGVWETVPGSALTAQVDDQQGLEGAYYRNPDWHGAPAGIQRDPLLFANGFLLEGRFSVVWRGHLLAPVSGSYGFGTDSDDGSQLYIDDQLVVDNGGVHGRRFREGQIALEAGWHDITIRYAQDGGGMDLRTFWSPPGQSQLPLPMAQLRYPDSKEAWQALPAPPLAMEETPLAPGGWQVGPLAYKWGKQGSQPGEFEQPRGIAIDSKGQVYVADSGNARVQVFDENGRHVMTWLGEPEPFQCPWDVVVTASDEVLVLDAGTNWIHRYSAAGQLLQRFGEDQARFYHPRGMSIDPQGNVYVADTGGHRIVAFSGDGLLLSTYGQEGTGPGQLLEPTDMAVDGRGNRYIVDNSNQRIQRWDANNLYQGEWAIPVANAYNGPHVAFLPDATLLITVPERHEIWRYSPIGEVLGKWGGPGLFRVPTDLAISPDGMFLYVADTLEHQVHKHRLIQAP